jgi:hypothetical protein
VTIGGGACVNGGWVPASLLPCGTLLDPFTSIGGGICINGGWIPKGGGLESAPLLVAVGSAQAPSELPAPDGEHRSVLIKDVALFEPGSQPRLL